MNRVTRERLHRQSPPSYLPRIGYGWSVSGVFGYGSVSRARNHAKQQLGSFHVAVVQTLLRGPITVWVSEIRTREAAGKGSRYLDYTLKRVAKKRRG